MIPNIFHFVYGFKEQTEEFDLYKYIAIESAYQVNKPDTIYFYYWYEPFGQWWNKIKPRLTLVKTPIPTEIFGNPIKHYAHAADIVRLQKLNEFGGIYLDIDTICLKPFTDLLMNDFVMGIQGDNYGLCNATMLAKPNSEFGLIWMNKYKTFRSLGRDKYWDEHSVILPFKLSKTYPAFITILNSTKLFYPLWGSMSDILFNETINVSEYTHLIKNSYSIHLWDTFNHNYLKTLTSERILRENTVYNIFARKFLKNTISIVMLTYNRVGLTIDCLYSYLKYLDNDYIEEFIILDNNSDETLVHYLKYFESLHSKIKVIYSKENLGVCGGRTILFDKAKGDIIASIDSDAKLISEDFFEKCIHLLYSEEIGIVGVSGAFLEETLTLNLQSDTNDNDIHSFKVDHVAGCCQVFRKDLELLGVKLDSFYGKFWVEDTDFCLQVLELGKVNWRIPQIGLLEHKWGGSGSHKELTSLLEKNWNYFKDKWSSKIGHTVHFIHSSMHPVQLLNVEPIVKKKKWEGLTNLLKKSRVSTNTEDISIVKPNLKIPRQPFDHPRRRL